MMKTLAILLFSALALTTGCATDAPDEPTDTVEIDKPTKEVVDLEPAVKAWAEQFVNEPRRVGPHGALAEWAEEIVLAGKQYTLLHERTADHLLDSVGTTVVTIPCHVCNRGL